MMRHIFPILLGVFVTVVVALPAHAENEQDRRALCQTLVQHVPAPDVAYQPGVDVHGKPVAPADLPGGFQLQKTFTIPLTVPLAKALGIPATDYPLSQLGTTSEVQIGTLTVDGDTVLYNGQPLTDAQQDNLAVLCMQETPTREGQP